MQKPPIHPELIAEILEFCEAEGLSKADFGITHMGDPNFVYDLEAGRECRRATIAKIKGVINPESQKENAA